MKSFYNNFIQLYQLNNKIIYDNKYYTSNFRIYLLQNFNKNFVINKSYSDNKDLIETVYNYLIKYICKPQ